MQKTVPLVVKFLGPLVQLLMSLAQLIAGSALVLQTLPVGRRPGMVLAQTHHIAEIQVAMQAHASQYVWYMFTLHPCTCYATCFKISLVAAIAMLNACHACTGKFFEWLGLCGCQRVSTFGPDTCPCAGIADFTCGSHCTRS